VSWIELDQYCCFGDGLRWPVTRCLSEEGPEVSSGLALSLSFSVLSITLSLLRHYHKPIISRAYASSYTPTVCMKDISRSPENFPEKVSAFMTGSSKICLLLGSIQGAADGINVQNNGETELSCFRNLMASDSFKYRGVESRIILKWV
jgi:hypothetical protein